MHIELCDEERVFIDKFSPSSHSIFHEVLTVDCGDSWGRGIELVLRKKKRSCFELEFHGLQFRISSFYSFRCTTWVKTKPKTP